MLNKNCIKTILNVKYTCIDKVTMLADTSIMIEVHATKGEQCRCGICGKKSKFYDNGNEGARTWRACDWAKLFWLDLLAESIVRSMVSLHAASLGLDMVLALHVNSRNRLLGWLLIVLV